MNTTELLTQTKKTLQAQGQCMPTLTIEFVEDGKEPTVQSIGLVSFPEDSRLQRHILHQLGHQIAGMYPMKNGCFDLTGWQTSSVASADAGSKLCVPA